MDLGPTVLSLLNIEPPKHYDGKAIAGQYEESQGICIWYCRSI